MISESIRDFLTKNHQAVLVTFRRSGAPQMSIVTSGLYKDGAAFTTTAGRAKLANLKRDPRCALMVSQTDWWGFVVLEGRAELLSPGITEADELRLALRDVYRAASGRDHPDWDEYDQAMKDERRSVIIVVPEHVYGTGTRA